MRYQAIFRGSNRARAILRWTEERDVLKVTEIISNRSDRWFELRLTDYDLEINVSKIGDLNQIRNDLIKRNAKEVEEI